MDPAPAGSQAWAFRAEGKGALVDVVAGTDTYRTLALRSAAHKLICAAALGMTVLSSMLLVYASLEAPLRSTKRTALDVDLTRSRATLERLLDSGASSSTIQGTLKKQRRILHRAITNSDGNGSPPLDVFSRSPRLFLYSPQGNLLSQVPVSLEQDVVKGVVQSHISRSDGVARAAGQGSHFYSDGVDVSSIALSSRSGRELGTFIVALHRQDLPVDALGRIGLAATFMISATLTLILLWPTSLRNGLRCSRIDDLEEFPPSKSKVYASLLAGCCLSVATGIWELLDAQNTARTAGLQNIGILFGATVGEDGSHHPAGLSDSDNRIENLSHLVSHVATVSPSDQSVAPYTAPQNLRRRICMGGSSTTSRLLAPFLRCDELPPNDMVVEVVDSSGEMVPMAVNWLGTFDSAIFGELTLQCVTGAILAFLVGLELVLLFRTLGKRLFHDVPEGTDRDHSSIRSPVFLFLFAIDISMSFLPLHVEALYEPMFGISKEVLMGLPLSAEFLFVGLSMIFAGVWLDRRGWRAPLYAGIAIALAGSLYSAVASDVLQIICARALVGTGYGLALMAAQGLVIARSGIRSRAQGLAHLFAGLYSGSICGAAIGALIAERMGYEFVFLLGACLVALVLALVRFLYKDNPCDNEDRGKVMASDRPGAVRLGRFLGNRIVLGLMILSSLPASIAVFGFLYYFSPIYLDRIGAPESTIGQVLMVYGVCMILIGPAVSRLVDRSKRKRDFVLMGCLLGSSALLSFTVFSGVWATAFAVFLLGLSSTLVLSSQTTYLLQLRATRELGDGKALAIFRASSRIGQMLGPLVFASVAFGRDVETGVGSLGVAYLVATILFFALTMRDSDALRKTGE